MKELNAYQKDILSYVSNGILLKPRPYEDLANKLDISEKDIVLQIQSFKTDGIIKRFGPVVRHHEVGYRHNAMVVWDVDDKTTDQVAKLFLEEKFITLCYRRPRIPNRWNYNLFCMIHGSDKNVVLEQINFLKSKLDQKSISYKTDTLFSKKRYKQKGADYFNDLEVVDKKILNEFQDGIEITQRPYLHFSIANNISEDEVLFRIKKLLNKGYLSRFGPMFNVDKSGGLFVLCAVQVDDAQFESVAKKINSFDEVAHNYRRNHFLNMWFVLAVENKDDTNTVLQKIETEIGLKIYAFPKIKEFFVDLRFKV